MSRKDAIARHLNELVLDHGAEICFDHRKVERALDAAFPTRPPASLAAHVAVRTGVAADLATDPSPEVGDMVFDRLVARLGERAGLESRAATWAVRAWAAALGRSTPSRTGRVSPPPPPRKVSKAVISKPGPRVQTLRGHRKPVSGVRFSPGGGKVATSSLDRTVRIWDAKSGAWFDTLIGGHRDWVRAVAWSPDGMGLASAGDDGALRLWNPRTGERLFRLAGHDDAALAVAWSDDGDWLASGGRDGRVCLWHAERLDLVHVFEGLGGPVRTLDLRHGQLAMAWDGGVRVVRVHDHKRLLQIPTKGRTTLCLGPGGRLLIGDGAGAATWDTRTGDERIRYQGHRGGISAVSLHPNGACLATGGQDRTVRIYHLDQAREVWRFEPGRMVTDLDVGPNGAVAMAFANGECELRQMVAA